MSLVPFTPPHSRQALARSTSRDLARLDAQSQLELARLENAIDLQVAKVHGLEHIGGRAMQAAALLSQLETQLALTVPSSSGRVQLVADVAAMGLAGIVSDTVRKLR